jgi:hypothetical protein
MHGVKAFSFFLGKAHEARGDDFEPVRLEHFDNVTDVSRFNSVGLDNGKSGFYCHISPIQDYSRHASK